MLGDWFVSREAAVSHYCALERGEGTKAYCERLVDDYLRRGLIRVGPPSPDARVMNDGQRYSNVKDARR